MSLLAATLVVLRIDLESLLLLILGTAGLALGIFLIYIVGVALVSAIRWILERIQGISESRQHFAGRSNNSSSTASERKRVWLAKNLLADYVVAKLKRQEGLDGRNVSDGSTGSDQTRANKKMPKEYQKLYDLLIEMVLVVVQANRNATSIEELYSAIGGNIELRRRFLDIEVFVALNAILKFVVQSGEDRSEDAKVEGEAGSSDA